MRAVPRSGRAVSPGTRAWAKHCREMVTAEHLPTCTEETRKVDACHGCVPEADRTKWLALAEEAETLLGLRPQEQVATYEQEALW